MLKLMPMKGSTAQENRATNYMRLAALASVGCAILLILVKAYAYWSSGSVSVLASLLDSAVDSLASLVNLFAIVYATRPADEKHRFGHGKAESLAGLGQSILIMISAAYLLMEGIQRISNPRPLQQVDVAVAVMLFSILVTFFLVWFQNKVVKMTESVAVKADSMHYLSDLLTNVAIILALVVGLFGWHSADALLAIGVAVYIFYIAVQLWSESTQHLLDRALPLDQQRKIQALALRHPDVTGVHSIRTRQAGRVKIIQLHLQMDGNISLWQAHRISDDVERRIQKIFPNCDVLIHQDPYDDSLIHDA